MAKSEFAKLHSYIRLSFAAASHFDLCLVLPVDPAERIGVRVQGKKNVVWVDDYSISLWPFWLKVHIGLLQSCRPFRVMARFRVIAVLRPDHPPSYPSSLLDGSGPKSSH